VTYFIQLIDLDTAESVPDLSRTPRRASPLSFPSDYTIVIPGPLEPGDMSDTAAIDETTLTHRVVLLGVADLAAADGTPAHAGEVRRVCRDDLAAVEGDVLGTLTEAEVTRALNELEAEGLVSATRGDTSATGKGRPRFDLGVDRDSLFADLRADDRISSLVDERSD